MKTKIAALMLLGTTTGSTFAHGGDAIAGFAVGTIVGNIIASQPRAAVTVQYGSSYPPDVVYAPAPVVGYAPPPPLIGYAPPPPAMVYPAPRVMYQTPAYGYGYRSGWREHHYRHRDFDGHGRWGHDRW
jgi:hypothetical protein